MQESGKISVNDYVRITSTEWYDLIVRMYIISYLIISVGNFFSLLKGVCMYPKSNAFSIFW